VATDIDGHSVSVPTTGKPGAVWFFAGWCGECLPVGRTLGQVQAQLGSRVSITGISPDPSDSESALRSFRQQDGSPRFPFIWNSTGSLGQQYAVTALDTTLVYDTRGTIVYRGVSPDLASLQAAFRRAGVT
jgi:thiol-disulfide isomerase/thioredoxin